VNDTQHRSEAEVRQSLVVEDPIRLAVTDLERVRTGAHRHLDVGALTFAFSDSCRKKSSTFQLTLNAR
jgi:hypothetical protein